MVVFAPLRGGRCVCMFMTDADLLATTPGSALARWEDRMHRTVHLRSCVEEYPVLTRVIVRSARSQRLDRMSGRAWIAVGDAAAVFDPLSSHGIAKSVEMAGRRRPPPWNISAACTRRWSAFRTDSLRTSPATSRCGAATTLSKATGRTHRSGAGGSRAARNHRHPPSARPDRRQLPEHAIEFR